MIHLLLSALLLAPPQEGEGSQERPAVSPEALRSRVNDMRMNLLLGGDQVRRAEAEAVDFYSRKLELVERRLDVIESDLRAKRSAYDLKLDQALSAREPGRRDAVMREANVLRGDVSRLERENAALVERRASLSKLVGAVQARDREREALVTQLDTAGEVDTGFGLPFTSIGLAPAASAVQGTASPYEDSELMADLMARDERAARRLLFESDPERYFTRFPLRPPAAALRSALDFPLPDLPGGR